MQIPKRLKAIGNLIHEGANIADIGADHGLLEQYIALTLKDYHILAIENKEGPLDALRKAADCLKNVEISHSDGMNQVSEKYDTVVLAGMGGDNIVNILSKNPSKLESVKHIIVDAHSFIPKVRKFLIDSGFDIDQEKIIYEYGVYYIIISFKKNTKQNSYSNNQIEFGYNLSKDPLYPEYKKYTLGKYKKVLKNMKKSHCKNDKYYEIVGEMRRFKKHE